MDSAEVRQWWAERSGEYSPDYYAHYGPDETSESVRSIIGRVVRSDASILELGCSSGRHLAHLQEHGYEKLAGIEVNDDAFDVMAETYPELAAAGSFHCGTIEAVVEGIPDDHFDVVYSVETLQHLHPDAAWVYDEITRITDELLVTIENEGDDGQRGERVGPDRETDGHAEADDPGVNYVNGEFPLYYRDWQSVFTDLGFEEVETTTEERTTVHGRDTVRAFRQQAD